MESSFRVSLKRMEQAAAGTGAFYFERPDGFEYVAGQFVELILSGDGFPSEDDRVHSFSLASAPCEDELIIATRLRDSVFKQTLRALAPGDGVEIEGPYGNFTLREDTPRPLVYLAGGVGITPIRSMLRQAADSGRLDDVFLFYANRTPDEGAFAAELDALQETQPGFRLVSTVTAPSPDLDWRGERGRIDFAMLSRYLDPLSAAFYVSGPPGLVAGMRTMLTENGVAPASIRFENFSGY